MLCNIIAPPSLRHKSATDSRLQTIEVHPHWPVYGDVFEHPPPGLASRRPIWSDMTSVDTVMQWREDWYSQMKWQVVGRVHLLSASRTTLVIPTTRRTTLGGRAFPVTAARAWNALPSSVRSAPSLLQFRRDLKTALHVSVIVLFTIVSSCVTDCNCNL